MKNTVREDIDAGVTNHSIKITIKCTIEKVDEQGDNEFGFDVTIDELGQICLIPKSEWCMFTASEKYEGEPFDITENNHREAVITLHAHMIGDTENFDWFTGVDEIGNAMVVPDSADATFISVADTEEGLNLITQEPLEEDLTDEQKASVKEDLQITLGGLIESLTTNAEVIDDVGDNLNRLSMDVLNFNNKIKSPFKRVVEELTALSTTLNAKEESLQEGTWSIPKSLSDVMKIKRILNTPITTENAKEVKDTLYNVFGDDSIYDYIDDLEDGEDARASIKDYIAKFVTANKDKFTDRVANELIKVVNAPLREGVNKCYIAIIHIDDEDGTWVKVDAPTKEMAADFLMQELTKQHPDAEHIRVDIDDVVRVLGESFLDEEDDELETPEQEFSSAKTSINSSKLPAIFGMVTFKSDTLNLDYGGGKFDNAVEALAQKGVTSVVYDPYNRTAEHNRKVLKQVKDNGGADTITCSNVLNVIKEETVRMSVLRNMRSLLKDSGIVYITVYEGTGTNIGKETSAGYQLNRKTSDYLEEVSRVFSNVSRKGKLIVCKK